MFLFPAVLHLALVLPGRPRHRVLWRLLYLDYALFAGLAIANAFDLLVADLRVVRWGYYSIGGPLYNFFTIIDITNFAGVFALLIYEYRTTVEARMRLQLKFWLFGMAIALPLGLTNLLPAYGIPFYPLGNLGSAVWAGIVAYAIVRHRLMDIEVVVSRGIAYIAVALLLLGPAFLIGILMQRLAFDEVHYDFSAGLFLLLLVTAALFSNLTSRAELHVERSLFPRKQASRDQLFALARSLPRILDRDRLTRELCDTLRDVFVLDRIALFLREEIRGKFEVRGGGGPSAVPNLFAAEHPLLRWLSERGEPTLRHEIEFRDGAGAFASNVLDPIRSNGWEVVVPLITGSALIGFLALGRRTDLSAYTSGDLDLLGTVADQASVALENARLYEELRRSRDIINRAGRLSALGTLAAGIAHEIRNPLVSIQTFFQLAPHRIADEEFMTSFLRLAEAEVQRISSLITELLSFAKSPATSVGEVDIEEIIERTLTLLVPQARAQNVALVRGSAVSLPQVLIDPDQIMQVLINLVLNAIQATAPGGTVTVETRMTDHQSGRFCQIEVRDTGSGIPFELREAIFNPFFTTKDRGTGLGLPIAHRIVAEAGGFLTVESVEGQGSQFFVHLPPAEVDHSVERSAVGIS